VENRAFFVFGDLISNAIVGAAAAWLTHTLIGHSLGMFFGMVLGMALGMVISMVLTTFVLSVVWGAMEVMLPCMVTGMLAGMVPAMWHSDAALAVERGIWIGLVVTLATYLASAWFSQQDEASQ